MRRLAWGIGVLLALTALALAVILVPPHLQIRGITPALPTQADLSALSENADGPVKISYLVTATQQTGDALFGHTTFVAAWADGKILLIDLGMDRAVAAEFSKLAEGFYDADLLVSHGTVPEFLGSDLSRVEGVAFTHLHQDHVQGIEPLCAAAARSFIALQSADQLTEHNFNTGDQSDLLKASPCIDQVELSGGTNFSQQFPGIGVYPLGGHTPGSTLFAIPVGGKLWLLSGDISNSMDALLGNHGKGFVYSYLMVPENEPRLEDLRLWLSDLGQNPDIEVVVSHDVNALIASGMDEYQSAEPAGE